MTQQYQLPLLPSKDRVLSGLFSAEQLETHIEKHHGTYIKKMNAFLESGQLKMTTMLEYLSQNDTLEFVSDVQSGEIYNQVAQSWNHTFFWLSLGLIPAPAAPSEKKGLPDAVKALRSLANSRDNLKTEFLGTADKVFGSGYVWLVWDRKTEFKIIETANALPPLNTKYMPLLSSDVWEHSYYLDYKSDRHHYVEKCWEHLSWDWAQALVADPSLLHHVENLMKKS